MAKAMTRAGSKKSPVVAALAEHGFPTRPGAGLCFRRQDDDRFVHGYPHVRRLVDTAIDPKTAAATVDRALDSLRSVLPNELPRDLARRFLLGYRIGPLLFVGEGRPVGNAKLREERAAAVRSDGGIDKALLDATLDVHGWGMGDSSARWRWPKVLFLYEGFLGTEVVARTLVAHLLRSAVDVPRWGSAAQDSARVNATPHYLALALPWLLMRAEPRLAEELRAELSSAPDPQGPGPRAYFLLLQALAKEGAVLEPGRALLGEELAIVHGDVAGAAAIRSDLWEIARRCWLLGTERFGGKLSLAGEDSVALLEEIAPIRDPAIVRIVARIATQRAGNSAAADWLRMHADYARPILLSLLALDDEKEKKAAALALGLMGGSTSTRSRQLSDDELKAEIAKIFTDLGKKLRASEGIQQKEADAIRDAYDAYAEARSAAGSNMPTAYFTHHFADFGLGDWGELAADSID